MRLIDADAMKKFIKDVAKGSGSFRPLYNAFVNIIDRSPTIDAVPVVHGRWINRTKNIRGLYDYRYDCSVCQHIFWYGGIETFNYCPECGAKMDGGENG